MGDAKRLEVKPISRVDAERIIRRLHYSGKVVRNSTLHLGVFLDGRCGGAMQFGPSLDKRKVIGLVRETKWNEFIELNRMAFADWLPRNGESRCIAYAMRWIRKTYPQIQWVISFADACQCGDGTIYRASGFVLTGIKKNAEMWRMPDGTVSATSSMRPGIGAISHAALTRGGSSMSSLRSMGARPLVGHQLRYIYFVNRDARSRLTVDELPFSRIEQIGAAMYRGEQRVGSAGSGTPPNQGGRGGATPTSTLSTP